MGNFALTWGDVMSLIYFHPNKASLNFCQIHLKVVIKCAVEDIYDINCCANIWDIMSILHMRLNTILHIYKTRNIHDKIFLQNVFFSGRQVGGRGDKQFLIQNFASVFLIQSQTMFLILKI